jgi:hypothetical protein
MPLVHKRFANLQKAWMPFESDMDVSCVFAKRLWTKGIAATELFGRELLLNH